MHILPPSLATNHKTVKLSLTMAASLDAILDLYFSVQIALITSVQIALITSKYDKTMSVQLTGSK